MTDNSGCKQTRSYTITQPAAAVSGSTVITNASCFGGSNGSINLTPSGGTAPYTFNWGNNITTEDRTGLAAGNYSVTITDANGCTATVNASVTQPAASVSGSTVITNASCFGGSNGSINLTPSGGTAPYTFNWGSNITTEDRTGLAAGNYSVTITDDKGCTATVNATVTEPAVSVSGSTVITNVSCFGGSNGSINLTASGGTAPYTFNWGGGITTEDRTGLAAGNYSVIITDDKGCTATVNATVTEPAATVSGSTVITNAACFGGSTGSINLTPSGGIAPYTFNWGNNITTEDRTGLAAGNYSVTITDANGCTGTVNATVTEPSATVSGSTVITNFSCFGGSNGSINLTPSGGTAPYTFNWGGGITTEDRTGLAAGNYSVTITDANGCTGTVSATVTQPVASVSGSTVITNAACFGGSTGSINLTPSGGTAPYTFNWGNNITTEDRTGLAAGNYSVTITDASGCTATVNATVNEPSAISTTGSQTNVSIYNSSDGTATVTPSGGTAGYTYDWTPGTPTGDGTNAVTGLSAGTWVVTITDANGCTATRSFTITQPPASNITDYFRTKQSGNWNNITTWESSSDNSTWIAATLSPDNTSNIITIQSGHTVTVTASVTTDQTFVNANASLVVSTGATLTVPGNGGLTIRSTAVGTGSIGNSAGTISGNVTVERYIPGRRAYRLLAPSVNTTGTIYDNWQEGGNNAPGYGTHITGSRTGSNGFDVTQSGAGSFFLYQYGTPDSYQPVTGTNTNTLSATTAYLLFVRGDRTPSHVSAAATGSNTTLRATGSILSGNVPYALQGASRVTLVTNPYASAISWNSIYSDASTTGLENYYVYLDPTVGSRGGYVTVTNTGVTSTAVNATVDIQSGQAFFVKSTASGTPALTIKESHKSSSNNRSVFRTGTPEQLSINLYYTEADGTRRVADGVNTLFNNNYSVSIDGNDAEEIGNFDENIAIKSNGKVLAIEGRPLVNDAETIELEMARMKVQPYEFEFTPRFNAPGMEAFLRDKFLNTETAVSLASKTVIPFTITNDAASQAADRFMLVFKQAGVLPVNMGEVKAYRKSEAIQVEWTTLTESSVDKFEVEKSIDGVSFTKAATVKAKGNSTTLSAYNWIDNAPVKGYNYYRIKTISINTPAPEYSKVVRANMDKATGGAITVYPNPVKGNVVSLQLNNIERGAYTIVLSNQLGQQLYRSIFDHDGGSAIQKITLPASIQKGIYQLQVIGADSKIIQKLIKD